MTDTPGTTVPVKPSPVRDAASAPFFDGAAQGKLMIMRCSACDTAAAPGTVSCPNCLEKMDWVEASGKASVFSWAVVHQATHPGFASEVPYLVGTVTLAEGPRFMTRFDGLTPADMKIGLPVQAHFVPWPNGEYLPVFRPV